MTENKRFTETISTGIVTDNMTNKEYNCEMRIDDDFLNLVNTIAEENEQLKSKNRGLQSELQIFKEDVTHSNLQINKLTDENEQLTSRINDYDVALKTLQDLTDKKLKENEQLKQINRNLQDFRNFITEKNVSNEKQRKELQLQLLRLYNYFENYFEDTMSPNAFSEMWDNVKEDERWGDVE